MKDMPTLSILAIREHLENLELREEALITGKESYPNSTSAHSRCG